MEAARIGAAFREACLVELAALKPGNVHRYADGHGMTVADFEASAAAAAEVFAQDGLTVGARILRAVERTRSAVGCNTNLGIVLLCAPLAAAAGEAGRDLRQNLRIVLRGLDRADAQCAFEAIRLAAPAGLSTSDRHDVHEPAHVDLRRAMAAARERDSIARQYVTDFAEVFEDGVAGLRGRMADGWDEPWAAAAVYLGFLAAVPDSHIARKYGRETAEAVRLRAAPFARALRQATDPESATDALRAFDADLKKEGLNPGTSADLTVASLFARRLEDEMAADERH